MDIDIHRATTIAKLHKLFRTFSTQPTGWWFRGHADIKWELIPKAGRPEYNLGIDFDAKGRDLERFEIWQNKAVAYIDNLPKNELERLALAQHHGLATRLLDWTLNPLVATFFAACELPDCDGAVYCFHPYGFAPKNTSLSDLGRQQVGFESRAFSSRILNQRAVFTHHGVPTIKLHHQKLLGTPRDGRRNLARIAIDKDIKTTLLQHLDDYGINRVTLFPDLDGLSSHINWETQCQAPMQQYLDRRNAANRLKRLKQQAANSNNKPHAAKAKKTAKKTVKKKPKPKRTPKKATRS